MEIKMKSMRDVDFSGKRVLLRLDINSPIDPETKCIKNDNRIQKSLPTLRLLLAQRARVAIIAHQGDTLDYQNLIPLEEHAHRLSELLSHPVSYIDDVCGLAAIQEINGMDDGDILILGNLRYLCEEISTFEKDVKLAPGEMRHTWLIRSLAPLFDYYVNDAFSAAHRNCPSMTGFQEVLPTSGGILLYDEYKALSKVLHGAKRPSVFLLGGAKISDAFGMMEAVLANGTADAILTCGVTGNIFLHAAGYALGEESIKWLSDRDLLAFVEPAKNILAEYKEKLYYPSDLAYESGGARAEIDISNLPAASPYMDIGRKTIELYTEIIKTAGTVFINGPAGVYENRLFEDGTKMLLEAAADSPADTVIGGGDSVSAAAKYGVTDRIGYVCTAGGAMVRFMSGKKLALIEAMEKAYQR